MRFVLGVLFAAALLVGVWWSMDDGAITRPIMFETDDFGAIVFDLPTNVFFSANDSEPRLESYSAGALLGGTLAEFQDPLLKDEITLPRFLVRLRLQPLGKAEAANEELRRLVEAQQERWGLEREAYDSPQIFRFPVSDVSEIFSSAFLSGPDSILKICSPGEAAWVCSYDWCQRAESLHPRIMAQVTVSRYAVCEISPQYDAVIGEVSSWKNETAPPEGRGRRNSLH